MVAGHLQNFAQRIGLILKYPNKKRSSTQLF